MAQTAAAQTAPAASRASAFLKIDGIEGESTDAEHRGWIEIASFEMGAGAPGASQHGSGGGTGKVALTGITFVKKVDKASPVLQQAFSGGTHFKNAVLELAKPSADGHTLVYYRVTMNDAFVSSNRAASIGGGGQGAPTQTLTLTFGGVKIEYTQQKPDGSKGNYTPVKDDWDVRTNVRK